MKKYENFKNSLGVLLGADFQKALSDEIYRTGIIGQFCLTFELAWKYLQAKMREDGISEAENGVPRAILKLAYKFGFINDEKLWLLMLEKRNMAAHVYDEEKINEIISLIKNKFIVELSGLVE